MTSPFTAFELVALAARVQRLGNPGGIIELMRIAVSEERLRHADLVPCVCRLLFDSLGDEEIRPPRSGQPAFIGRTTKEDWPLSPIHVHNEIPFYVVRGYTVAGLPEHPAGYLAHCLECGCWRDTPIPIPTAAEITDAAHDLVTNGPWTGELCDEDRGFLLAQAGSLPTMWPKKRG